MKHLAVAKKLLEKGYTKEEKGKAGNKEAEQILL